MALVALSFVLEIGSDSTSPNYYDFIQCWSALRIMADGINPYDPAAMYELQKVHSPAAGSPIKMWLPPWAMLLMSPWLILPLPISARAWLLSSIVLWLIVGKILANLFVSRGLTLIQTALLTACFPPCLYVLKMGQVSIFCLFGIACT